MASSATEPRSALRLGSVVALAAAASLLAGCARGEARAVDQGAAAESRRQVPKASTAAAVASAAVPLPHPAADYSGLLAEARDAGRILLGEATHGTSQFYEARAAISEQLIRTQGVNAVAIEGDWSATFRLNQYVRGLGSDASAEAALAGYTRFPKWMWRNIQFRDFVERLRALNMERPAEQRVGLYGMDVYDMFDAADAVVAHLGKVDAEAASRARASYRCFASYKRDTARYGEASRRPKASCQDEVRAVVADVAKLPRPSEAAAAEAHFSLLRSAASVLAAEEYFRAAFAGSMSWNLRDRRMSETIEAIAGHAARLSGRPGKVVVWAHNSHVGDARATSAVNRGELNLGQLMRQRHRQAAFLIGFFTYQGTVMAAPEWDRPGRVYQVRPGSSRSYSGIFHASGVPSFWLALRGRTELRRLLAGPLMQRAIGVVYRPETEQLSHYFSASLPDQFDAVVHFDRSEAVTPLAR